MPAVSEPDGLRKCPLSKSRNLSPDLRFDLSFSDPSDLAATFSGGIALRAGDRREIGVTFREILADSIEPSLRLLRGEFLRFLPGPR